MGLGKVCLRPISWLTWPENQPIPFLTCVLFVLTSCVCLCPKGLRADGGSCREMRPRDHLQSKTTLITGPPKGGAQACFQAPWYRSSGSSICPDGPVTSVSFRTFRTVWHQAKLVTCSPQSAHKNQGGPEKKVGLWKPEDP